MLLLNVEMWVNLNHFASWVVILSCDMLYIHKPPLLGAVVYEPVFGWVGSRSLPMLKKMTCRSVFGQIHPIVASSSMCRCSNMINEVVSTKTRLWGRVDAALSWNTLANMSLGFWHRKVNQGQISTHYMLLSTISHFCIMHLFNVIQRLSHGNWAFFSTRTISRWFRFSVVGWQEDGWEWGEYL